MARRTKKDTEEIDEDEERWNKCTCDEDPDYCPKHGGWY